MINLKDAKLGEQYNCYVNNYGEVTSNMCDRTIVSTVIAVPKDLTLKSVILGWKRDKRPNNALYRGFPIEIVDPGWNWLAKHNSYAYEVQVNSETMKVHSKVTGVDANLDGCLCSKCTNFFQFAESNQTDGSFVCWSCRSFS